MGITLNNLDTTVAKLRHTADLLSERAWEVVKETLDNIQATVETAMGLPKHGIQYGDHTASEPGEPPAIDTKELIDSVQIRRTGPSSGEIAYTSGHAAAMEHGTPTVAARPFLAPATIAEEPDHSRRLAAKAWGEG